MIDLAAVAAPVVAKCVPHVVTHLVTHNVGVTMFNTVMYCAASAVGGVFVGWLATYMGWLKSATHTVMLDVSKILPTPTPTPEPTPTPTPVSH